MNDLKSILLRIKKWINDRSTQVKTLRGLSDVGVRATTKIEAETVKCNGTLLLLLRSGKWKGVGEIASRQCEHEDPYE